MTSDPPTVPGIPTSDSIPAKPVFQAEPEQSRQHHAGPRMDPNPASPVSMKGDCRTASGQLDGSRLPGIVGSKEVGPGPQNRSGGVHVDAGPPESRAGTLRREAEPDRQRVLQRERSVPGHGFAPQHLEIHRPEQRFELPGLRHAGDHQVHGLSDVVCRVAHAALMHSVFRQACPAAARPPGGHSPPPRS